MFGPPITIPQNFGSARIAFNHLVRYERALIADGLRDGILRMCAIWGWPQQQAFDFCIPMIMENNDISGIFIQVKNKEQSGKVNLDLFRSMIDYTNFMFNDKVTKFKCIYIGMSLNQAGKAETYLDAFDVDICIKRCESFRPYAKAKGIRENRTDFKIDGFSRGKSDTGFLQRQSVANQEQ